jgi:replicative DNA helicase
MNPVLLDGKYVHISTHMNESNQLARDIAEGRIKPLLTSVKREMDVLRGFLPTDQIIVGGRSGCGKSSRMIAMMDDFCNAELNPYYKDKLIIAYDSWEMTGWRNASKFLGLKAGMTSSEIFNYEQALREEQLQMLESLATTFADKPIYINEMSDSVYDWYNNKKKLAEAFPEHTVVNIVDHTRLQIYDNHKTEEANITALMKAGMVVKKEFKQINFFLTQLNRSIETSVKREEMGRYLPVGSDIFGSDAAMQNSDMVILLHRPGLYGLQDFHYGNQTFSTGLSGNGDTDDYLMIENVVKNRNGDIAPIIIEHDIKYNRFNNYNPNRMF